MKTTKKILAKSIALLIPLMVANTAYSWTDTVGVGDTVIGETVTPETLPNGDIRHEQHVYGTVKNSVLIGDDYGNEAHQFIYKDGVAENTTINNGAWQYISGGGAIGTVINEGGHASITGGFFNDAVVNSGGLVIANKGVINNIMVNTEGRFDVYANDALEGVTVNRATLANGTTSMVTGNAQLNDWTIAGQVTVFNNGVSGAPVFTRADVLEGGTLTLYAGGQMTDSMVNGGNLYVFEEDSLAENTTMNSGVINVGNQGRIKATIVNGGILSVKSGGTATGTIVNGGSMTNTAGWDIDTVINDGSYSMVENESSISDNLTVNETGTAYIGNGTLNGATLNGIMFAGYDGYASIIKGNINVGSAGKFSVAYNNTNNTGDANLNVSGEVFFTNKTLDSNAAFYFNNVKLDGGSISFGHADGGEYTRLNLASLDGTGAFWMNTDIANQRGDFLNVTGEANGDFDVYIADSGSSPNNDSSLQIIQTGGGHADFTLANVGHMVDLGTYIYYLESDGHGGWALTPHQPPVDPIDPPIDPIDPPAPPIAPPVPPVEPPTISPSTAAVLSMATVDPLIFQAELNTVHSRLEEVRSFSHDTNFWGRTLTSRYNVNDSAGAGYDMSVTGVVMGADESTKVENGIATKGAFFSYSHSNVHFDRKGGGNVDSYSVGAYASYLNNDGLYLDGVIKANHFGNDVNAKMTSGAAVDGYYNTAGIGANIKGGKYFNYGETYIAPYASLTGFTTNGNDYGLSNGMKAKISSQRSVLSEIGLSVGHRFTLQNTEIQPYIKLAMASEFMDNNKVKVNSDDFVNDLSGTRGIYQLGVNAKVSDRLTVHVDAGYSDGARVETPWTANIGLSMPF